MLLLLLSLTACIAGPVTRDVDVTVSHCGAGQFKNVRVKPPVCQKCPPDRYMDEASHINTVCKICTLYYSDSDYVIEKVACTSERDTGIKKCAKGYRVERKKCQRCRLDDCGEWSDCCEITVNSTASPMSSNSTPQADVASSKAPGPFVNLTKCDDIDIETTGCLGVEYEKASCLEYNNSLPVRLPCQQCSKIIRNSVTFCVSTPSISSDQSLQPFAIVLIVIIPCVVLLLIACLIYFKFLRNKNCCQKRPHSYTLNKDASSEETKIAYDGHAATVTLLTPTET